MARPLLFVRKPRLQFLMPLRLKEKQEVEGGGGGLMAMLGRVQGGTPVYARCGDDSVTIEARVNRALHGPVGRLEAALAIDVVAIGCNKNVFRWTGEKEEDDGQQKEEGCRGNCGRHQDSVVEVSEYQSG